MKECIKHGNCWRQYRQQVKVDRPTMDVHCKYCEAVYRITTDELIEVENKTIFKYFKCPECGHLELIQQGSL